MNQKSLLVLGTCLVSTALFGEVDLNSSSKVLNASISEQTTENTPSSQVEKGLEGGGDITLKNDPGGSPRDIIAYPIKESNFENIFERRK